ncbi:heme ABC transporter permease [Pacificimonas sp. WHA3]|uniref:Heme exporter protein C n=1 Tax=Pacificimonas pallii TaxID=2827236 RepID=A0ABS6SD47_9SPHN|nr:heme ABC transporter permease [Pacificimonas pallii]MBV7256334.1 heme ABC transporter permease [Pacificimonas pallii]
MHRYANPKRFLEIAQPITMWTLLGGLVLVAGGLWWGLFRAPPDYLQGESVRIIYIHVPMAWLSMAGYLSCGVAAFAALVWKHPLAEVALVALAPIGAVFSALCLLTGSLWGRPTWGTYWVWDGRLTSVLVLFFLYLGIIALARGYDDPARGAKMASVLALFGLVNLPIIKFSVEWWNTLHQPASITLEGSSIDQAMLWPLLASAAGFSFLMAAATLMRMRALIAARKRSARAARLAQTA